jgi:hypothetical protein
MKYFFSHFSWTPCDLILIVAGDCPSLANDSSIERHLNLASLHYVLRLFQSILQHVHHAHIKEIKATSCFKKNNAD